MENAHIQGLIGTAGKHIAQMPNAKGALERLRGVGSPEEFRRFLQGANLGIAPPATRRLIDAATGDDWQRHKRDLVLATDQSIVDRFSPSA